MLNRTFSLGVPAALLRSLEPLRDALLEVWPEALGPIPLHDEGMRTLQIVSFSYQTEMTREDGKPLIGLPGEREKLRVRVSFEMETPPRDGPKLPPFLARSL